MSNFLIDYIVSANGLNIATSTPTSSSDTGTVGDVAWDSDYIYICTATNTWKRLALSSFGASLPDISGLTLWLDASDSNTITLNDSAVSQWNDKSGNGYHCTQATASYRPTYVTSAQNGLNAVLLNSNNRYTKSYMQNSTNTIISGSNSRTVFVACKNADTSVVTYPFSLGTRANLLNGQIFWISSWIGVHVSGGVIYWSTDLLNQDPSVITVQTNGTNVNQLLGWLNGSSLSVSSSDDVTLDTQVGYTIGDSTASLTWTGYIMEVLVYDSNLSTSDRESVESYLASKWGITLS